MEAELRVHFIGHCFFIPGDHRVILQDELKNVTHDSFCRTPVGCSPTLSRHEAIIVFPETKDDTYEERVKNLRYAKRISFNSSGDLTTEPCFDKSVPKLSEVRYGQPTRLRVEYSTSPSAQYVAAQVSIKGGTLEVYRYADMKTKIGNMTYDNLAKEVLWICKMKERCEPKLRIDDDEYSLYVNEFRRSTVKIYNGGTGDEEKEEDIDCSFRWYYRYLSNFDGRCHVPKKTSEFSPKWLESPKERKRGLKIDTFCPPAQP